MIEFQRALELTSLDKNSFMNMCIVAGCNYVQNSIFSVKINILDQGSVFLFSPCSVEVVPI